MREFMSTSGKERLDASGEALSIFIGTLDELESLDERLAPYEVSRYTFRSSPAQ
jgi:hypothetical protein